MIKIIRWIVVSFLPLLSSMLVIIIGNVIAEIKVHSEELSGTSIGTYLTSSALAGYVFVSMAFQIAPSRKILVALLEVVVIAAWCVSPVAIGTHMYVFEKIGWLGVLRIVVFIIAAVVSLIMICKQNNSFTEQKGC